MALNLDLIGKKIGPVPFTYGPDTAILYALGIGAGVEELDFVYEKNLKVFPSFAVVPLSLLSCPLPFLSQRSTYMRFFMESRRSSFTDPSLFQELSIRQRYVIQSTTKETRARCSI